MMLRILSNLTLAFFIFFFWTCKDEEKLLDRLPEKIEITSQADIDELEHLLIELDTFCGDISIKPALNADWLADINLSAFRSLSYIKGQLFISRTQLSSLASFESLMELHTLYVTENNILQSIDFPKLRSVKHNMTISANEALVSIALPDIVRLEGEVFILDNPSLKEFKSSKQLEYINRLSCQRNPQFTLFSDLNNLQEIEWFSGDFTRIDALGRSFERLTTFNELTLIIQSQQNNFNWLEAITYAKLIQLAGNIVVDELCPLKSFASDYPDRIFVRSWLANNQVYNGLDIIDSCQ